MTRTHYVILACLLVTPMLAPAVAAEEQPAPGTGHICYVDSTVIAAYCADATLDPTVLGCNIPHTDGYACRVQWTLTVKTTGVDVCGDASATTGNIVPTFCTYAGGRSTSVVTVYYQQSASSSTSYTEDGVVRVGPAGVSWKSAPITPISVVLPPAVPASGMAAESPTHALAAVVADLNAVLQSAGSAGEEGIVAYDQIADSLVGSAAPLLA